MDEVKPTVLGLFTGCGGSSLGFELAEFEEVLAVEWDDNAAETFRLNFPTVPLFHGDIAALSVEECLKRSRLAVGQLDVLQGSPPCQGYSTAGNRKFNDPRNSLFKEYVRLLKGLQPKVFVMENVTGMIKGVMKQAYLQIVEELRSCGYNVKGQVMNAMYYNVPQSRQRVIIIGVRNDLGIEPSHPKPQNKSILTKSLFSDLPNHDEYRHPSERVKRYAASHAGGWSTNIKLMHKLSGKTHSCASLKWCEWGKTPGTICKSEIVDGGVMHPDKQRYLSMHEIKILASFPSNFKMLNRKNTVERIGNSVPPNLMKAIALHIKVEILSKV